MVLKHRHSTEIEANNRKCEIVNDSKCPKLTLMTDHLVQLESLDNTLSHMF